MDIFFYISLSNRIGITWYFLHIVIISLSSFFSTYITQRAHLSRHYHNHCIEFAGFNHGD